MYFKIEVSSETGNKIAQLLEREIECNEAALKVANKWGFKNVSLDFDKYAAGGISIFRNPTAALKRSSQLFSPVANSLLCWTPKKNTLAKGVRTEVANLPVITYKDWNEILLNEPLPKGKRIYGKVGFDICGRWFVTYVTYAMPECFHSDCQPIPDEEAYNLLQE